MACRAFYYNFGELRLTPREQAATSGQSHTMSGFLAWRRTLLQPCTGGFLLATALRISLVPLHHYEGSQEWLRSFFGESIFDKLLCADCAAAEPEEQCTCESVQYLEGIFVGSIVSDALLALTCVLASAQLMLASRDWSDYGQSCRRLRHAYGALFLAPFIVLLLLPLGQFLTFRDLQTALCRQHMLSLATRAGVNEGDARHENVVATIDDTCSQPIDDWASSFEAELRGAGLLYDEETGTCAYEEEERANASPVSDAADAAAECADDDELFAAMKEQAGIDSDSGPADCAAAAVAASPDGASEDERCTQGTSRVLAGLFAACPVSCGTCNVARGRGRRAAATSSAARSAASSAASRARARQSGCVRPVVVDAMEQLSVALSSEALTGAVGIQQAMSVLATLLPSAMGLALGAAQGSTLAKCVLPSSRLPAYLAGGAVALGLPILAALLAFINTLVGGGLG